MGILLWGTINRGQQHGNPGSHGASMNPIGQNMQIGNSAIQARSFLAHLFEALVRVIALEQRTGLTMI
jgi:hypothetical protein